MPPVFELQQSVEKWDDEGPAAKCCPTQLLCFHHIAWLKAEADALHTIHQQMNSLPWKSRVNSSPLNSKA